MNTPAALFPFVPRVLSRAAVLALVLLLSSFIPAARAGYAGPVPAPTDAFGGPGLYAVTTETFPSPDWPGQVVTVFLPLGAPGRRPTWFFAHGFAGTNPAFYQELLTHLASHGEVVVFSPYPADLLKVSDNYATLFDGFVAAAQRYANVIDTTRVGFAGHSYGGGAVPALALRAVREKAWGSNGLALLLLAPWYSYFVSDADLASFPAGTQAVVQIYEDDTMNDHRMAIDVFDHLGLAAADKDFVMLRSDRIDGYNYDASHLTPTGAGNPRPGAGFDALDAWGVRRIAQALGDSAWNHDAAARAVALGHGGAEQVKMGATAAGRALRPMVESSAPVPLFPMSRYKQPFNGTLNPRSNESLPALAQPPHVSNLSVRGTVDSVTGPLIVGAAVSGARPKSLLVRAVGPGLAGFGVSDFLADPTLRTFRDSAADLAVDDWSQSPDPDALAVATSETGAFPLKDGSSDAAVLASYAPGTLTVQCTPASAGSGTALVELYDAEDDDAAYLANLSARAHVAGGDATLIAGLVAAGPGNVRLLIRAVGPGLSPYGVTDALADPVLELHQGDAVIASNDNWSSVPTQRVANAAAAARVGAFALPEGSTDAALVTSVAPGSYSAVVRARDGKAGTVLVEVYVVPRS